MCIRDRCHNERNPCCQLLTGFAEDSDKTAIVRCEEGGDDVKSARPYGKLISRWVVTDEQRIRQRMIYVRHYFPGVNLDTISDEEFAMLSDEALWLHEQMLISRMPVPMSLPERTP